MSDYSTPSEKCILAAGFSGLGLAICATHVLGVTDNQLTAYLLILATGSTIGIFVGTIFEQKGPNLRRMHNLTCYAIWIATMLYLAICR